MVNGTPVAVATLSSGHRAGAVFDWLDHDQVDMVIEWRLDPSCIRPSSAMLLLSLLVSVCCLTRILSTIDLAACAAMA